MQTNEKWRILITGATGFLGRNLAEKYVNEGNVALAFLPADND